MLAALGAPPGDAAPRHPGGALRRTPVFIVCSPRPRVGRTLIARLLVDYLVNDGRAPLAFDANPDDPVLSAYQPRHTVPATVADTAGEMALFDRLIVDDGRPKVIDLAPELFDAFFASAETIAFVDSAHARRIDTVALFLVENHARAIAAHRDLLRRFPGMTVVPVVNEMLFPLGTPLPRPPEDEHAAVAHRHAAARRCTASSCVRASRFSDYFHRTAEPTMLHRWIADAFIGFRDIELRLQMAEFASLFSLDG